MGSSHVTSGSNLLFGSRENQRDLKLNANKISDLILAQKLTAALRELSFLGSNAHSKHWQTLADDLFAAWNQADPFARCYDQPVWTHSEFKEFFKHQIASVDFSTSGYGPLGFASKIIEAFVVHKAANHDAEFSEKVFIQEQQGYHNYVVPALSKSLPTASAAFKQDFTEWVTDQLVFSNHHPAAMKFFKLQNTFGLIQTDLAVWIDQEKVLHKTNNGKAICNKAKGSKQMWILPDIWQTIDLSKHHLGVGVVVPCPDCPPGIMVDEQDLFLTEFEKHQLCFAATTAIQKAIEKHSVENTIAALGNKALHQAMFDLVADKLSQAMTLDTKKGWDLLYNVGARNAERPDSLKALDSGQIRQLVGKLSYVPSQRSFKKESYNRLLTQFAKDSAL